MKKLFLLILALLIASTAYAANFDAKVTSNTVAATTTGVVVTFNSVINHITFANDVGSAGDIWVNPNGDYIGWTSSSYGGVLGSTYILPAANSQNSVQLHAGDAISFDVCTKKVGYIGESTGTLYIIATSDREQP